MSLSFRVKSISGRKGPQQALIYACSLEWAGPAEAYLLDLSGRISFKGVSLSEIVRLVEILNPDSMRSLLRQGRQMTVEIVAPISRESIEYVEKRRTNNEVPVFLDLSARYQLTSNSAPPNTVGPPTAKPLDVIWTHVGKVDQIAISHSDWLRILSELGESEFELFEIPMLPFRTSPEMTRGHDLLVEARKALHESNFMDVLSKCRSALESIQKHFGKDDIKKGSGLLLEAAFPHEKRKQKPLNQFINGLSAVCHVIGRHEHAPALHVSKEEAHFVLVSTVGFVSMVIRRLPQSGATDPSDTTKSPTPT